MSSVNSKYIKDENGNIISPVTSSESIFTDEDGTSLSETLTSLQDQITLLSKQLSKATSDTGWLPFTSEDDTYINGSQSAYVHNKWRVRNNTLYVSVGYGVASTTTIDTTTETADIAIIPIMGGHGLSTSNPRVWSPTIGRCW